MSGPQRGSALRRLILAAGALALLGVLLFGLLVPGGPRAETPERSGRTDGASTARPADTATQRPPLLTPAPEALPADSTVPVTPEASAPEAVRQVVEREPALRRNRDPRPALPSPAPFGTSSQEMEALGFDLRVERGPGDAAGAIRSVRDPVESLFVLPDSSRVLRAAGAPAGAFLAESEAGALTRLAEGRWRWTAPSDPGGPYRITLRHRESAEQVVLNAFVLVPREEKEGPRLNGYRIGHYPATTLGGNPIYRPPVGFVEVTEENQDARVSPRFRLRHFPAKQGTAFPKYVALQPELLTKLERLVDALNERGHPTRSLFVMSGYRTPYYNRRIGNVKYSRHQWGGAADVFVDERPRNGVMDDLNRDGDVNVEDARLLYRVVDSLDRAAETRALVGGLGLYRANSVRGPFVHVDVRGSVARW